MITREILNSHPIRNLKAEIRKVKKTLNYSKLTKDEIVDLMMKNKDNFKHIKMYEKPARKTAKPKTAEPPKVKAKPVPKTAEPKTAEPKKVKAKPVPKKPAKKIKILKGSYKQKLERVANNMFEKLIKNLQKGDDDEGQFDREREIEDEADDRLANIVEKQGLRLYELGRQKKDSTFFKRFTEDSRAAFGNQYIAKLKYDKLNIPNRKKYLDLLKKQGKPAKKIKIKRTKFIG